MKIALNSTVFEKRAIGIENVLHIHHYLIKKHNIKWSVDFLNRFLLFY